MEISKEEYDRLKKIEELAEKAHRFVAHFWDLADGSGCHVSAESMDKFDAIFNELGVALGIIVDWEDVD
jgi:hypothetical protein